MYQFSDLRTAVAQRDSAYIGRSLADEDDHEAVKWRMVADLQAIEPEAFSARPELREKVRGFWLKVINEA